jgi:hypothetical protein
LPVKMGPLKGTVDNKQHAVLAWTTFTESQNKGFEIERSEDGVHFVRSSFIPSKANAGNSQTAIPYSYDAGILNKSGYFRVKQLDIAGSSTLTNTIFLQVAAAGTTLSVYPNPVHDQLNIQAPVQPSLHPHILILDLNGRVLLRKTLTSDHSKLNVATLAAGIYLLKYEDDAHTSVIRFIKK